MTAQYAMVETGLTGMRIVKPNRFEDERGLTGEIFNASAFETMGVPGPWVQDNLSWSRVAGTVRGLHHQRAPRAQAKLTRCLRGAILHVAVDLRRSSATFGRWDARALDAGSHAWIFTPAGCAQGFMTLVDDCEVLFKLSDSHIPNLRGGLVWNDPDLAIPWSASLAERAVVSAADRDLPSFSQLAGTGDLFD